MTDDIMPEDEDLGIAEMDSADSHSEDDGINTVEMADADGEAHTSHSPRDEVILNEDTTDEDVPLKVSQDVLDEIDKAEATVITPEVVETIDEIKAKQAHLLHDILNGDSELEDAPETISTDSKDLAKKSVIQGPADPEHGSIDIVAPSVSEETSAYDYASDESYEDEEPSDDIDKKHDYHKTAVSPDELIKHIASTNQSLKDILNVNKKAHIAVSNGTPLSHKEIQDAIANRIKQSDDSLHAVDSTALVSLYEMRVSPLSHGDNDEVDKIGEMNWGAKSTWVRLVNFIYKHISTENTGYPIPNINYFKKLTAMKDLEVIAYDLFRGTFTDKSIPFSFKCQTPECIKTDSRVTHALNASGLKQYIKTENAEILESATAIDRNTGNVSEWLKNVLRYTRTQLNFNANSNVLMEIQDLTIESYLSILLTEKEEVILESDDADKKAEIEVEIENRKLAAYTRRIMFNINGIARKVQASDFKAVIAGMDSTDRSILKAEINRIELKAYVKFAIPSAVCGECGTKYHNIPINPLDLLFRKDAAVSRGWMGIVKGR